jgi:hypothetical protein
LEELNSRTTSEKIINIKLRKPCFVKIAISSRIYIGCKRTIFKPSEFSGKE